MIWLGLGLGIGIGYRVLGIRFGLGLWFGLALGPLNAVIFYTHFDDPSANDVANTTQTVDERVIN